MMQLNTISNQDIMSALDISKKLTETKGDI